jgi:poly [ADP-ribose] polymerase
MITKEGGLRYAKLIHVSADNGKTGNSNKVYIMEELADGRIQCDYGRVGRELTREYKDKSKWESVLRQKLSTTKGYNDVTELMVEPVVSATGAKTVDITDAQVKQLMNDLMNFANQSIQRNYKVTQEAVSEQQVNAAQDIIDSINQLIKNKAVVKDINDSLIRLYTTIPRKMKDVRDHLVADIKEAKELIASEQDTLDTMAGQVKLLKQKADMGQTSGDVTILEQMGITMEVETDPATLELIYKLLGPNKNQVKRIFKVSNPKTRNIFDKRHNAMSVKKKRLYWHGSRNENWFNLLQTGLMIRPAGAVHTGSMFGDGCYFSNKSQKSIGYTSLKGSYWTGGSANKGYLALFDVSVGRQKEILNHTSSCYSLCEKVLQKDNYDSVFAKGGADLRNNEYVIYNMQQCTISHLMELGN